MGLRIGGREDLEGGMRLKWKQGPKRWRQASIDSLARSMFSGHQEQWFMVLKFRISFFLLLYVLYDILGSYSSAMCPYAEGKKGRCWSGIKVVIRWLGTCG